MGMDQDRAQIQAAGTGQLLAKPGLQEPRHLHRVGIRTIGKFVALANAIITVRPLICVAWTTHRRVTRVLRRP